MGTDSEMKSVYLASLREDWKSLAEFHEKHKNRLLTPMAVSKDTAFHMAVYSEDEKLLKDLLDSAQHLPPSLDHEHPINITNVYGNTPLHLAVSRGNFEAVKLLVEESKKILVGESENEKKRWNAENQLDRESKMGTPSEMNEVYFATLREDWKSLAEFYEKHKDRLLTPMRVSKDIAFHMAVYSEDEKLLKDLLAFAQHLPTSLDHEHPINITNVYGNTPLHLAASRGNYEAVKLLVEESQKVLVFRLKMSVTRPAMKIPQEFGKLWRVAEGGIRIVDLAAMSTEGLYGARIGSPVSGPATRGRKVEDKGVGVDLWHPLLTATKTGILEVVYEMLREYPQSVDLLNKKGQNVLHVAIMYRRKDIFKFIKSNRIISNRMSFGIDKDGYTLLHQVADNTYYSVGSKHGPALQLHEELKWFTAENQFDREIKMGTPSEMKPAYIATLEEDWKSLAEFYEKHKDRLLTPMPFTKDTAFHMAVYCKDAKLLKCLLDSARYLPTSQDHKHPISITNVYGHTPLHLAASRGNYEAVKLLVEESQKILVFRLKMSVMGQLMKIPQEFGKLWRVARGGKGIVDLAAMSTEGLHGASTGSPVSGPSHPLFTATKTGILEVVYEMLIEQPHFLDLLDEEEKNILHVAIKYRRKDIFHLIKSNRIISNRMSYGIGKDGYTLLHQVADNEHYSLGSKHGPALQLHEELKWFTGIRKAMRRSLPWFGAPLLFRKRKQRRDLFQKKQVSESDYYSGF
ncbi:hypothetical protein POTOM_047819 [Populus tomentosa]|uniref:Ankyrin repeat family protein n=1 Tax=Populus tomentosa TaxID=118781 RepID=A0A8X7Y800_POPTO|nr:hypothetical protein POTOM_047819 [Populus tomentosa]